MIRRVYIDLVKEVLGQKRFFWLLKRVWQYFAIRLSYFLKHPIAGPVFVTFLVTYRCNYHCKMCDLPDKAKSPKEELSTTGAIAILNDLAHLGVSGVSFGGGEPLLRSDIFELIAYAKKLGMLVHLNTNGFFLSESNAVKLVEHGVDSLNISLDGANAVTHDAMREVDGAFDLAVSAIKSVVLIRAAKLSHIRIKIASVIDETNLQQIPDILLLGENLGVDCVEFIPQQPMFLSNDPWEKRFDEKFMAGLDSAVDYILGYQRTGKIRVENSPAHLKLFKDSFCKKPFPFRCYTAYNSCAIDPYGYVYPCVPWVNMCKPVGNILDKSLKQFWYSAEYNKVRKDVLACRLCYLNCHAELSLLFDWPKSKHK